MGGGVRRAAENCTPAAYCCESPWLESSSTACEQPLLDIRFSQFANSGGPLQSLMKEIASGPDAPYYHYAPDSTTLQTVFQEVANHLSELRLSK